MTSSSSVSPHASSSTTSPVRILLVPGRRWSEYDGLADQAFARGNLDEAIALWQTALKLLAKTEVASASVSRVAILERLACAYYDTGSIEEAEVFLKRAAVAISNVYGSHHVKMGGCLNNLAGIHYRQRRYVESECVAHSVLAIYENQWGKNHPQVASALHNLGMIDHALGKYAHSERCYRRAYRIRSTAFGAFHPLSVKVILNYSALLEATGRVEEAEALRCKGVFGQ
jgi:tetratricopeptide (TPR) repeat protein